MPQSSARVKPSAPACTHRAVCYPGEHGGTHPRQHRRGALRGDLDILCAIPAAGAKTHAALPRYLGCIFLLVILSMYLTWPPR